MTDFSIRDILTQIDKGNLRIPAFQRGFVWDAEAVAFLMDSIYKGYPFGNIQLWRTKEKLISEKKFGPFQLFERDEEYPIDYILDGQQRITSIFGVFQNNLMPSDGEENPFKIYFDLLANEGSQDSQFVFLDNSESEHDRYFPLNCLFDSIEYRLETEKIKNKTLIQKVDKLQEIFKEAKIPYQTLATDDKSKVAIVFERINRQGVPLDTLQLLTAWTWSENFDLQDKFEELKETLEPFGFGSLGENVDLILKIGSAVLTGKPTSESLIEMNGNEVRDRFDEIINGIEGAIDFIKNELKVANIKYLPYEHQLIPLSVFFSNKGNKHFNYNSTQREVLLNWFWKTAFSNRYSAGTNAKLFEDITEIIKLKNNEANNLSNINVTLTKEFFKENKFTMGTVNTKTLILLLAAVNPLSFITGSTITLEKVLKDYNRKEFHHIYPKNYLKKLNKNDKEINCLANFCFLSRSDNKQISDKKPSEYRALMPEDSREIFESSFIEESSFLSDDFENFIEKRSDLILKFAISKIA